MTGEPQEDPHMTVIARHFSDAPVEGIDGEMRVLAPGESMVVARHRMVE